MEKINVVQLDEFCTASDHEHLTHMLFFVVHLIDAPGTSREVQNFCFL
jgi:hypothetical protein